MEKLLTIPAEVYYADKCDVGPPRLSQSMATTMLNSSPFHAFREHPRMGKVKRDATRSMEKGTIVHDILLGGGAPCAVLNYADFRTKAAQADRDAAIAGGKTPILASDYHECQDAAAAIRKQLDSYGIRLTGQSEGVALWEETASDGTRVPCKARIDHWISGAVIDLKTCVCAHPGAIQKKYCDFGYDIQSHVYPAAIREMLGLAKYPDFFNVFVEMESPWLCTIAVPDSQMIELGDRKWRKAIDLFAECDRTGVWPAYATKPVSIAPSRWQISEFENPTY